MVLQEPTFMRQLTQQEDRLLKECCSKLPIFPVINFAGDIKFYISKTSSRYMEYQKPYKRMKKALFKGKLIEEIKLYNAEYQLFLKRQLEISTVKGINKETGRIQ